MSEATDRFFSEWFPDADEDDFSLKLRIQSRWDEAHFRRMMQAATAVLDEAEATGHLEPTLHPSFTGHVDALLVSMSHPGFLAENDLALSRDAYREYIGSRAAELRALRARYDAIRARPGAR